MSESIYLDYSASTPLRPEVAAAIEPYLGDRFGNPSSVHTHGRDARVAIEGAREAVKSALGVSGGQLVFTGTGTEADNLALLGWARKNPDGCVIHSSIEHKAVLESARALEASGYDVRIAPVDSEGVLDMAALEDLLPNDDRPTLVSVMWANNETGAIQPIGRLSEMCRERGACLHSDAVQALGKAELDAGESGVDLIAISAHKLGGPQGVGALWIRQGMTLEPLIFGGGHQSGLRSGSENTAGCVGFAAAAALAAAEREVESARLAVLRDRLQAGLEESELGILINSGQALERLPNVLNISVPEIDIEGLLTSLDLEGIRVSSGSACTTGTVRPSHVITAMGREGELASNTIRFSLGWRTQPEEIDRVLEVFPRLVRRVREFAGKS